MEACVDSVLSALNAENGGATRLEVCANLSEGGTTPSIGLLQEIKRQVSIPAFVMIRPRGGDFCYDDLEMAVMKQEIKMFKQADVDGFVFGILTREGDVDEAKCKELLNECRPFPTTFHRAIDMSRDLLQAMAKLIDLGFQRILTSGGKPTAPQGVDTISKMVKEAQDKIIIVAGGGIRMDNVINVLESGVNEFHATARKTVDSEMIFQRVDLQMGAIAGMEYVIKVTSKDTVIDMVAKANEFWQSQKK